MEMFVADVEAEFSCNDFSDKHCMFLSQSLSCIRVCERCKNELIDVRNKEIIY